MHLGCGWKKPSKYDRYPFHKSNINCSWSHIWFCVWQWQNWICMKKKDMKTKHPWQPKWNVNKKLLRSKIYITNNIKKGNEAYLKESMCWAKSIKMDYWQIRAFRGDSERKCELFRKKVLQSWEYNITNVLTKYDKWFSAKKSAKSMVFVHLKLSTYNFLQKFK